MRWRRRKPIVPTEPFRFGLRLEDTMLGKVVCVRFIGELIGSDELTLRVRELTIDPMDNRAGKSQRVWPFHGYDPILIFDVETVYEGWIGHVGQAENRP